MAKYKVIFDIYDAALNACDFFTENKELKVFTDSDYPKKLKEKVLSTAQIGTNKNQLFVNVDLTEDEHKFFYFLAGFGAGRTSCRGLRWMKTRYDLMLLEEHQKNNRIDSTE